jgi:hypothetical protein
LRQTLADIKARERAEILARIDRHRESLAKKYGVMEDSTPGIRAERDGEPDA